MTDQKPVPEILFDDSGDGNAIVFLHGFLESSKIWNEFRQKLENKFRILTIDLPGHGGSSCLAETHTMDLMAEEIRNILEILGINKVVLVGHSLGGYVALAFAKKFKRFVKGIVLLHSHAGADSEEQKKNRDLGIKAVENDHLGFIASFTPTLFAPENVSKFTAEINWLKKISAACPKEGVTAVMRGMKEREDQVKMLEKLNLPVLAIAGDKDTRIPVELLKNQLANVKNARLEVLKNVGHMGFIEDKENTFKLIRNFAQSVYTKK